MMGKAERTEAEVRKLADLEHLQKAFDDGEIGFDVRLAQWFFFEDQRNCEARVWKLNKRMVLGAIGMREIVELEPKGDRGGLRFARLATAEEKAEIERERKEKAEAARRARETPAKEGI